MEQGQIDCIFFWFEKNKMNKQMKQLATVLYLN